MLKNNHIISILAVLILVSCARRSVEPDTLVSAAISISVGNILTSSAEVAVDSNVDFPQIVIEKGATKRGIQR